MISSVWTYGQKKKIWFWWIYFDSFLSQNRLSLKRNIETSPIKQTMSLMIDPVRVPRDIAPTSARDLSSSPGTGTSSTLKRTKPFTPSRAPEDISDEHLNNCADEASKPKEPRVKKLRRTESERRSSPRHNIASQDTHKTRVLRSGGVGRQKPVTKVKKRGKSGKKMPRKTANLDRSNKQCDTISKTSSENQTAIVFPERRRGRKKKKILEDTFVVHRSSKHCSSQNTVLRHVRNKLALRRLPDPTQPMCAM